MIRVKWQDNVIPFGGVKQIRDAAKAPPFDHGVKGNAKPPRKIVDGVELVQCDLPAIDLRRGRSAFSDDF